MASYDGEQPTASVFLKSEAKIDGIRGYQPLTPIIGGAVRYPLPPVNKGKKRP
jgi:hypothetical protein